MCDPSFLKAKKQFYTKFSSEKCIPKVEMEILLLENLFSWIYIAPPLTFISRDPIYLSSFRARLLHSDTLVSKFCPHPDNSGEYWRMNVLVSSVYRAFFVNIQECHPLKVQYRRRSRCSDNAVASHLCGSYLLAFFLQPIGLYYDALHRVSSSVRRDCLFSLQSLHTN